jgi:hypothetical protein
MNYEYRKRQLLSHADKFAQQLNSMDEHNPKRTQLRALIVDIIQFVSEADKALLVPREELKHTHPMKIGSYLKEYLQP